VLAIILFKCIFILAIYLIAVGEEDEVSIKEVAEMIVEAMNFSGEVIVSFFFGDCFPSFSTCIETEML